MPRGKLVHLTPKQLEAIEYLVVNQQSYTSIGKLLGLPTSTVTRLAVQHGWDVAAQTRRETLHAEAQEILEGR